MAAVLALAGAAAVRVADAPAPVAPQMAREGSGSVTVQATVTPSFDDPIVRFSIATDFAKDRPSHQP